MTYLLNEILLYLITATAVGAVAGWAVRHYRCNRGLAEMQEKLDRSRREHNDKTAKFSSYKNKITDLTSKLALQNGELRLMTSRWHSTLSQARQLPKYQSWLKKVQNMYQQTRGERDDFANLASHYVDLHADANQKIKRLNRRVTNQEGYQYRLDDMITKVGRLNSKITTSENDTAALYSMIAQIQSKWSNDRIDATHLSAIYPEMEEQKSQAQSRLAEVDKKYTEKFEQQQTQHQAEIKKMQARIDELTPLEGNLPGQDTMFNRFMDKVRLVGTSENTVLGRAYKQIDETKREVSEKERVFVDTCEEKDAVINDLREQVRDADNRAQAASGAVLQESRVKIQKLETEINSMNGSLALLREHEHTIEAFKNKLTQKPTRRRIPQVTPVKPAKARKTKTVAKKSSAKPTIGLKTPAKGLKIAAAKVKDDLKQVNGIGPVMEKKLNTFGVHSFEQLTKLTSNDIDALAKTLESFPGRIQRDKWVSQSKQLFKKKYGKTIS